MSTSYEMALQRYRSEHARDAQSSPSRSTPDDTGRSMDRSATRKKSSLRRATPVATSRRSTQG